MNIFNGHVLQDVAKALLENMNYLIFTDIFLKLSTLLCTTWCFVVDVFL